MTLSNQPIRYRYEGNGSTDEFSFPSRLFKTSDLIVQIVDRATNVIDGTLVSPADYTLVISSDGEGTITTTNPVANDKDILLFRDSDLIQPLSLPTGTPFPARDTETEFDRAMAVLQEHNDRLDRAAIVNEAAPDNIAITLPVPVEGRFLVWDDVNGTIVNSSGSAEDLISSASSSAATATIQAGIATGAASSATGARDDILNDAGFIAVAADLAGADTIGTVAADITDVVTAAANITAIQAAPQAAIDAEAARDKASEWADNPEDDPVETGPDRFSAFHWAQKAQGFASGVASNISYDNTSSGLAAENVQGAIDEVVGGLGTASAADLIDDDTFVTATPDNVPSAESVKAYVDANSGGDVPQVTVFTSSGTYNTPAGAKYLHWKFVGGGGGGGTGTGGGSGGSSSGFLSNSSSNGSGGSGRTIGGGTSGGGGGGGGGVVEHYDLSPTSSYSISVGSGGSGAAAGNGGHVIVTAFF